MSLSLQAAVFQELYKINNDPKRIEFLNDYSAFLHRKGTHITRLPVMSKQTLDLYELYRLVCEKGGVLEVINNKLWQEIIRKLRISSTITSAAFTLRAQYIKYLYPYECEKHNFSDPREVKAIVESNRREREARLANDHFAPHTPPQLSPFTNSPHNSTSLTSINPLLDSIRVNEESSLSLTSLLNRRNLMLQYMQYMGSEQIPKHSTSGQTNIPEMESPVRIKRERDDDDEPELDVKKSLLYNLLTPSNTESSYEEDRSTPGTHSEKSEDLKKSSPQDDILMMSGMQFNIRKGSNGKLIVNLTLDGVNYEGDLYKTS